MTFILAYAICTTVLACMLSIRVFKEPEDKLPPFAKACGQGLFFLMLVGICALSARGLMEISEVLR